MKHINFKFEIKSFKEYYFLSNKKHDFFFIRLFQIFPGFLHIFLFSEFKATEFPIYLLEKYLFI